MSYVKAFIGAMLSFLIVDAVWIMLVARPYYEETIGTLMRDTPDLVAAVAFYIIYVGGVVVLAVRPALESRQLRDALMSGAVLGGVAYGTFALTNRAVLDGWPVGLVITDIAWGVFLTTLVAGCGYWSARR